MKNTRIDNLGPRRSVGEAPNPETALFLAGTAFGLAMISLLAVLAFADIVELAHILPFFALPLVLFIGSAPLIRRWVKAEANGGSYQGNRPSLIEATVSEAGAHRDRWTRREATCAQRKSGEPTTAGALVKQQTNTQRRPRPKNGHRRREGKPMKRVAIVARLKEGSGPRAAQLISGGPPFDLAEIGLASHSVYLSAGEVVFIFEGDQVEWTVDELIDNPFRPEIQSAFDQWRAIIDGSPRIAHEQFGWHANGSEPTVKAMAGSGRWA